MRVRSLEHYSIELPESAEQLEGGRLGHHYRFAMRSQSEVDEATVLWARTDIRDLEGLKTHAMRLGGLPISRTADALGQMMVIRSGPAFSRAEVFVIAVSDSPQLVKCEGPKDRVSDLERICASLRPKP